MQLTTSSIGRRHLANAWRLIVRSYNQLDYCSATLEEFMAEQAVLYLRSIR